MAATEVVKAGGLGNDLCDLRAAGSAPEWMSAKAIAIGQYFVLSGVYMAFGLHVPTAGAPLFHDYLTKDIEKPYGGKRDPEADPVKHAQLMIAPIDKKRKELGIDKARERVLMDMADRHWKGSVRSAGRVGGCLGRASGHTRAHVVAINPKGPGSGPL